MALTAENIAEKYNVTREMQDEFAFASTKKAIFAQKNGYFANEIVPVVVSHKHEDTEFIVDEFVRHDSSLEALSKLKAVFKQNGTVTAGNASGVNDASAMVMLMTEKKAKELNLPILATIECYASVGLDPAFMGMGPVKAITKLLGIAGLPIDKIDIFEINEAFAAQSLAVINELKLDINKVNVNGGAIAIGHPIGASGCRILVTMIHEMIRTDKKYGVASLCIGGGMGTALLISR